MAAGGSQTTYVDGVINPVIGCPGKVSDGCNRCYAVSMMERLGHPPGTVLEQPEEWQKFFDPNVVKYHGLYLLCSTSDPFIPQMKPHWKRLAAAIAWRSDVLFLALTKRPGVAKQFVKRHGVLPNLWLGTSAENQETFDQRISQLYTVPAAGYMFSLQPLLGPIEVDAALRPAVKLVVAGCEAGKGAWRCPTSWLRQIMSQCWQQRIDRFITRWVDGQGRVHTSPTRNGRGSGDSSRLSYNPNRKSPYWPTIGERYFKQAS